jgi:GNAT superfamily N-acetyltransferase
VTTAGGRSVRPATPDELTLLPALESASDTVFDTIGITDLPPAGTVEELRAAAEVLVAGDPPVGFARLEVVDGQAHLEQLAVHPDQARRGLGTALVDAAVDWARTQGYGSMTLTTFRDVAWNGPFYARLGFIAIAVDIVDSPDLAARRDHERDLGLDAKGPRVAMRRRL